MVPSSRTLRTGEQSPCTIFAPILSTLRGPSDSQVAFRLWTPFCGLPDALIRDSGFARRRYAARNGFLRPLAGTPTSFLGGRGASDIHTPLCPCRGFSVALALLRVLARLSSGVKRRKTPVPSAVRPVLRRATCLGRNVEHTGRNPVTSTPRWPDRAEQRLLDLGGVPSIRGFPATGPTIHGGFMTRRRRVRGF